VGGFLRFVTLFVVLVTFIGLVAVPILATPVLTGMVRDMGLRSDTLRVSVELFDPLIFLGRSRALHVEATNVDVAPAGIGRMDLVLRNVSFFDQSWETVDGELFDLSLTTGGQEFFVDSVQVNGDGEEAHATARLSGSQVQDIVRFAARRQGVPIDSIALTDQGVRVTIAGQSSLGRLEVRGGALVLSPGSGDPAVALIQPAPSDSLRLQEVWISEGALNVRGTVDTAGLTDQVTGG
jgi:hypothetical protein